MRHIDIKKLNIDELVGVVNLYPWFAGARKALCERMCVNREWGSPQLADAALTLPDRSKLVSLIRDERPDDWSDNDVETLLKSYISEKKTPVADEQKSHRAVRVVGGDYFSQAEYETVRNSADNVFHHNPDRLNPDKPDSHGLDPEVMVYTETLAGIYLEQGYPEQAKRIYSKLILAYPEKNAYFAALIAKIDREIINQ